MMIRVAGWELIVAMFSRCFLVSRRIEVVSLDCVDWMKEVMGG